MFLVVYVFELFLGVGAGRGGKLFLLNGFCLWVGAGGRKKKRQSIRNGCKEGGSRRVQRRNLPKKDGALESSQNHQKTQN